MKVHVPPIKSQGIKTKLVPWIKSIVPKEFNGKWIEFGSTEFPNWNTVLEYLNVN